MIYAAALTSARPHRRTRRYPRRASPSCRGVIARIGCGAGRWPDVLEAPVAQRRMELAAVCGGILLGWAGLVGMAFSMLG